MNPILENNLKKIFEIYKQKGLEHNISENHLKFVCKLSLNSFIKSAKQKPIGKFTIYDILKYYTNIILKIPNNQNILDIEENALVLDAGNNRIQLISIKDLENG